MESKLPIIRFLLPFGFFVPAFLSADVFFHSNFEAGNTYLDARLKPGQDEMELVSNSRLEEWPVTGGEGVVESNLPHFSEWFTYEMREGKTLFGVKGIQKDHGAGTGVQTGDYSLRNWRGVSFGSGKTFIAKNRYGLFGEYVCRLPFKEKTQSLSATVPKGQREYHVRLYVVFPKELLDREVIQIPFCFLVASRFSFSRITLTKAGISEPAHVGFMLSPGTRMISEQSVGRRIAIEPGQPHCIEFAATVHAHSEASLSLWVDGEPQLVQLADYSRNRGQSDYASFKVGLVAQNSWPKEGVFFIDEVMIADRRLGSVPEKPKLSLENRKLRIAGPNISQKGSCHWQLSRFNSWLGPYYNSGEVPALAQELDLTGLAPDVLENRRHRAVAGYPIGLDPGKRIYARARAKNEFGNWSEWSEPLPFESPAKSVTAHKGLPRVSRAFFSEVGSRKELEIIEKGKWYDFSVHIPDTGEWRSVGFVDIYVSGDPENAPSSPYNRGGAFNRSNNYVLSFSVTPPPRIFVRERDGSEESMVVVNKALYCDNGNGEFQVHPKEGWAKARVRLLPDAISGPWSIRAFAVGNEYISRPHVRLIHVRDGSTEPPMPRIWTWVILAFLAGVAGPTAFFLLRDRFLGRTGLFSRSAGKKAGIPERVRLEFDSPYDENIRKAKEFIVGNYQKGISPKDVADGINVSAGWLSHFFRKGTGKTVIQYLHELRIEHAKVLLVETKLNIEEIAPRVGFNNPSHFSEVFRKLEGCSPKAFRGQNAA